MPWENKPPLSISCLLKLISDPNSKSEFCNLADTLQGNENLVFNEIFTLKKKILTKMKKAIFNQNWGFGMRWLSLE